MARVSLVDDVLGGKRASIAKAVTLVESANPSDRDAAEELLAALLPHGGGAHRIAVSGPPGVGKSTLIEALGVLFIERGHRVAVLAIDPSSAISGGSVLADKTRMPRLSVDARAFVRPSPSARTLGGVARRTREAMLVVEAAGFDVILVETVGVGQSETEAHEMVDTFLLLVLPGSGDELQGIKRGIVELADVVAVTKADGDRVSEARIQARLFENALQSTSFDRGPVALVSATTGVGVPELVDRLEAHRARLVAEGTIEPRRRAQRSRAVLAHIEDDLLEAFSTDPDIAAAIPAALADVETGRATPSAAARALVGRFRRAGDTSKR